jgi:hypothetical protein
VKIDSVILNISAILDCSQTQQVPLGSILKDIFKTVLGLKIRSIQLYKNSKTNDPSAICNISATQFLFTKMSKEYFKSIQLDMNDMISQNFSSFW